MMLLTLSCIGLQTNLQAKWHEDVYEYYCLARFIVAEKLKQFNPFAKAEAVEVEPVKEAPKFKKYRRKYTTNGTRIRRYK